MSNVQNILKTIKEKEIQFVDLRFNLGINYEKCRSIFFKW